MEETKPLKLYAKLANIYKKIDKVPKNGWNAFHKYKYVQESDAVEHCRKLFNEQKILSIMECNDVEINGELTKARFTIWLIDSESGESMSIPFYGTGHDKLDKGLYKAIAGGYKYFLLKSFMIPSDTEPERDNGKDPLPVPKPKPIPKPAKSGTVDDTKDDLSKQSCACGKSSYDHDCTQADVIARIKMFASQFESSGWKSKHQNEIAKKKQLSWPGVFRAWQDKQKELGKKEQEEIFP